MTAARYWWAGCMAVICAAGACTATIRASHWSVIHGYGRYSNDSEWLMSDPMGVPDAAGGHNPH